MQCPKCGTENLDDNQSCKSCGAILSNDSLNKPVKTSRLAIASLVLSFLSILTLLAAGLSIVFGILSLRRIKKHQGLLRGKYLAITGIVISLLSIPLSIGAWYLWLLDAPPIPNDYTIADLRSASPEFNNSYELLLSMSEKDPNISGALAIGLSEQDANNLDKIIGTFKEDDYDKICAELKAKEQTILQIWQNAEKGRGIINELDTFPEIADLTEPRIDAELPYLGNLRYLFFLYRDYICLQSYNRNEEIAVRELVKLHSIIKKVNVNARFYITKLVCIAGFNYDIQTANFLINNPQTSRESLYILEEHFKPLTKEQISLRNSTIFEYLMFTNELTKISKTTRLKDPSLPFLKLNSTLRVYKNFCDDFIATSEGKPNLPEDKRLTVWPSIYPNFPVQLDPNGETPLYYKVYNPLGAVFLKILLPAYDKIVEINTKMQIHYDLLQIVLNKRLGKEISLKARAYSDEYIVDLENKKIFSPGPDGIPHTEDDIKLAINPEVLNFTN